MCRFFIWLMLLLVPSVGFLRAASPERPRLVVNITIAGFRYDYLFKFSQSLSSGGIKRLMEEGTTCNRAMINYLGSTTPTGVATIASGTTPDSHGVIGTHWFDYTTGNLETMCLDKEVYTVGADELDSQMSPRNMVASTIGDCIKDVSPRSVVVSLAESPLAAVLAGGFLSDDTYWISPRDGKMVTSTYYTSSLPDWVNAFNDKKLANSYCATQWEACREASSYRNVLRSDIMINKTSLNYDFIRQARYGFERLSTTPAAATLLKDFAVHTIVAKNLGKDDATDYLSITFESPEATAEKYGSESIELEDVIYRLDDELAAFIAFVENYVGKENLLIVLNSAHGISSTVSENSRMPSGQFNAEQFEILMNGFLGAQLGNKISAADRKKIEGDNSQWVLDYDNNQLYLNRRKIFNVGLSLSEVQNMVAQFAIQFRGVESAITSTALQSGQFTQGIMGMAQKSYFARRSGDVVLNLLPGWITTQDKISMSGSPYIYDTHVPVIFWGAGVESKEINEEVALEDIAPTIANLLRVTMPNATTGKPIF